MYVYCFSWLLKFPFNGVWIESQIEFKIGLEIFTLGLLFNLNIEWVRNERSVVLNSCLIGTLTCFVVIMHYDAHINHLAAIKDVRNLALAVCDVMVECYVIQGDAELFFCWKSSSMGSGVFEQCQISSQKWKGIVIHSQWNMTVCYGWNWITA